MKHVGETPSIQIYPLYGGFSENCGSQNSAHISIPLGTVLNPDVPLHSCSIRSEPQEVGPRMMFQDGSRTELSLLPEISFSSIHSKLSR